MSCALDQDEYPLHVTKGLPFTAAFQLPQKLRRYRPITVATQAAPCVLTVPAHGLPPGWEFAIRGARGMTGLNRGDLDQYRDLYEAVVVDADTIELNDLNTSALPAYTGGGEIEYLIPEDLSIYTEAESQWRELLTSTNAFETLKMSTGEIVLDNANKLVTIQLTSAMRTAALPINGGVYNLVLTGPGGIKTVLIPNSPIRVELSATR